jgi:hypothetical protein
MNRFATIVASLAFGFCVIAACLVSFAADKPAAKNTAAAAARLEPPPIGPATHPAKVTLPPEPQGMVRIFDGKDLTDWEGNPKLWSVRDGCIRGETTKQTPTSGNTFCIWTGGTAVGDFDFRCSYRLHGGNSGIQYRSHRITGEKEKNAWVVGGYQCEIAGAGNRDGYLYEERGKRGRMALVGDIVRWDAGGRHVLGQLDDPNSIFAAYRKDDWNELAVIAEGNHVRHFINGVQTVDFTDEDPQNALKSGVLAIQIHAGGPMVIEMKDLRIKRRAE